MKVAIVHDYLKEYGGAERVLEALCEVFPDAPIYTAFFKEESDAYKRLRHHKIIPSWAHYIPFFATKLHSPLRFLAPLIWESFDLSEYDVVISSASWYVTKGIGKNGPTSPRLRGTIGKPIEICYCHTPPRWLYGYATSVKNQKSKKDYYLIVSRIVGAKGLEMAIEAAKKAGFKLKIAGSPSGYYSVAPIKGVEFLGQVTDEKLVKLYKGAKAFLALSKDEDFGITPVEAMLCGTPVIAFNGGGYKETVLDKKTGLLFDDYSVDGLISSIKQFESLKLNPQDCVNQAQKFSKERFKREIKLAITEALRSSRKHRDEISL